MPVTVFAVDDINSYALQSSLFHVAQMCLFPRQIYLNILAFFSAIFKLSIHIDYFNKQV